MRGDSANFLISFVADPNVSIQESKAFTGNIRPGRRNRGALPMLKWHDKRSGRTGRDWPEVRQEPDCRKGEKS